MIDRTVDDVLLEQLRLDGIIGPFVVSDLATGVDVGAVRTENEDRAYAGAQGVFAVADGLSGRPGGALAADTAIAVAAAGAAGMTEPGASELLVDIQAAIVAAGRRVGNDGLGTTLVVLAAHRNHVVIASVGDSRAYRYRDGDLERLTVDHDVGSELRASGVSDEQASGTGLRLDALTAHLGPRAPSPLRTHVASYSVMAGDRFLLCTDGIHRHVAQAEISSIVALGACALAVEALLAAARRAGGRDNAAAVLVEFGRPAVEADHA
jgi:serine/threonine protein phosphatase PrpC